MPSTFTSNTGIEKIADGEQTGAWGQTTNDNFDIVDRALNGSVSISLVGTTHTLTTSNGILSDGQAAVLVFTGSPSGTNTVTIEPNTAQKTYVVRNTTAQSVVLTQGSGANVTVPAGLTKLVYTDGGGATAAVVDITNTLSGTFTGNLTGNVTGNVTGNASTATALQTARTIGGVSFNGTANINLPGVNQAGNQDTTGDAAGLTGLTASVTELNVLDGITVTTEQLNNPFPPGGIIMWSGSIASVPAGWFLCDGTNGTPDMRDRFVVGAGSTYAVNATGGANTVTLTAAQMPAHGHTFSGTTSTASLVGEFNTSKPFPNSSGIMSTVASGVGGGGDGDQSSGYRHRVNATHNHTISGTTASVGSGEAHENRPPYLALAYIMKA